MLLNFLFPHFFFSLNFFFGEIFFHFTNNIISVDFAKVLWYVSWEITCTLFWMWQMLIEVHHTQGVFGWDPLGGKSQNKGA
jgi:hypothetical protein